jgi:hypothetical protein
MADILNTVDVLSESQLKEGREAVDQFQNFHFGTVVTTPELARSLTNLATKNLAITAGVGLFVSEIDFRDQVSVQNFLKFWGENEELLGNLSDGKIDPKDIKKFGHDKYPIFLFINPTNLDYLNEYALGSKEASDEAISTLKVICQFGRINIAITPNLLEKTGTGYPKVPESLKKVLADPGDHDSKFEIVKYLFTRNGIKKLGLQQYIESSHQIITPTKEALEKLIIS